MTARINLNNSSNFLTHAQTTLNNIELQLEALFDTITQHGFDYDLERSGGVLNIHCVIFNQSATLILNIQTPMEQLWLATPQGGFHYTYDINSALWLNTRGGLGLREQLSKDLSIIFQQPILL